METLIYSLDRAAVALVVAQCGAAVGLSIVVIIYYARRRQLFRLSLLSLACYILLSLIISIAIAFNGIFAGGWSRVFGMIASIIAFGLGDIVLWQLWHVKINGLSDKDVFDVIARLDRQGGRLAKIEQQLIAETKEMTLPEVVKVQIVERGEVK